MSKSPHRLLSAGALLLLASSEAALAENLTPDLQVNGYATVGMAALQGNQGATYPKNTGDGIPVIQTHPTAEADTVAGLQFKYRLNDQADMVIQEVAAGQQDPNQQNTQQQNFSVRTDWAYLDYHFNDDLTLRAGRFAFSTFMYSENQRVGEAYPWVRLPQEIYSQLAGLTSMDGIEMLYKHNFGDWTLTLQPNYAEEQLNGFAVNNGTQIAMGLSNDTLSLHLGTGTSPVTINLPSLVGQLQAGADAQFPAAFVPAANTAIANGIDLQHDRAVFSDAGFIYDDGKWFGAGEFAALRVKGWFPDHNAGYVSVGHYFGKWLPYVLYSRFKTVNNYQAYDTFAAPFSGVANILAPSLNYQQATTAIGARYQFKPDMSLKLQADRINGFDGSTGLFNPAATTTQLKNVYIYSIAMTAAF